MVRTAAKVRRSMAQKMRKANKKAAAGEAPSGASAEGLKTQRRFKASTITKRRIRRLQRDPDPFLYFEGPMLRDFKAAVLEYSIDSDTKMMSKNAGALYQAHLKTWLTGLLRECYLAMALKKKKTLDKQVVAYVVRCRHGTEVFN